MAGENKSNHNNNNNKDNNDDNINNDNNTCEEMVQTLAWLLPAPLDGAGADTLPPAAGPRAKAAAPSPQRCAASPPARLSVCWRLSRPFGRSAGAGATSPRSLSVKSNSLIYDCGYCSRVNGLCYLIYSFNLFLETLQMYSRSGNILWPTGQNTPPCLCDSSMPYCGEEA